MNPIIELEKVTISYRENIALKDVSLKVFPGEFIVVAGPNGAGKTTLLTAINGLGKLLKGKVRVNGIIMGRRTATQIRKITGYVPQVLRIDPRMPINVREAVMLGRYGRVGVLRRLSLRDEKAVDGAINLTKIRHLLDRPIGHLSGGELQKVSIARALSQEPQILLLDEPLSNLDISAQEDILRLIEEVHRSKNLTTLMVMHYLNLLPRSATRLILLKNGNLIFDGPLKEGLKEDILSHLYDCRVEVIKNGEGVLVRVKR
ncbi:ABC transporter ATP-binding protein [Candidatus Calescamantes bacterium]|nr:ABC transporter ATP-binding protein [Candidatus Calescamantes bacterium]